MDPQGRIRGALLKQAPVAARNWVFNKTKEIGVN